MNSKIYVPEYHNGECAYVLNKDTIRIYETHPSHNSTIAYRDYFITSSYIGATGTTTFTQYSTLPTCLSNSSITTDYAYRIDFPSIIITAFIICFVAYFFVSKIVRGSFLGWRWS